MIGWGITLGGRVYKLQAPCQAAARPLLQPQYDCFSQYALCVCQMPEANDRRDIFPCGFQQASRGAPQFFAEDFIFNIYTDQFCPLMHWIKTWNNLNQFCIHHMQCTFHQSHGDIIGSCQGGKISVSRIPSEIPTISSRICNAMSARGLGIKDDRERLFFSQVRVRLFFADGIITHGSTGSFRLMLPKTDLACRVSSYVRNA